MRKLFYFSLLLLLIAGLASAQNQNEPAAQESRQPRPRIGMSGLPGMLGVPGLGKDWWRNSEIAQQINLNDQQKQQLGQIFSNHRDNLVQLRQNVDGEEGKLAGLLDQEQPQQDQVLAEVAELQAARNALEKEFTVMSLSFRGVLTPEQWKQLRLLAKQKMLTFKMRRSENGPRGNGPPPQP